MEGSTMAAVVCSQCGKPLPRPADQPPSLKVYTPTPNGFERFLREAVGLPVDVAGGHYSGQVRSARGAPK
jgi:hypothetical protein